MKNVNDFFTQLFGPSWRTTLSGYIGAAVLAVISFLHIDPSDPSTWVTVNFQHIDWSKLVIAVVIALVAANAKDKQVSNSPYPLPVAKPIDQPTVSTPTTPTGSAPSSSAPINPGSTYGSTQPK